MILRYSRILYHKGLPSHDSEVMSESFAMARPSDSMRGQNVRMKKALSKQESKSKPDSRGQRGAVGQELGRGQMRTEDRDIEKPQQSVGQRDSRETRGVRQSKSAGKISIVMAHWDLFCVCVCAQLYPTLFHPMDCSLPDSSVHGIFQARILQWVAISSSRGSSLPWDGTPVSCISCNAGRFFLPLSHWGSPSGVQLHPNFCQSALVSLVKQHRLGGLKCQTFTSYHSRG